MRPMARLKTRFIRNSRYLVEHFDGLAPEYFDAHGPAERLLAYRLVIIRRFLAMARMGTLLEIGCGTGIHLLPLAGRFGQAHGIDVSPEGGIAFSASARIEVIKGCEKEFLLGPRTTELELLPSSFYVTPKPSWRLTRRR
jgi:hypothetical protein